VFAAVIVALTEPPSVADDRLVLADRTSPWQEVQRDHPGSILSLLSGSAIKRITAGVKAPADSRLQTIDLLAGPSPSRQNQIQTKEEYCFRLPAASHLS
jgi:hypothetical protein